MRVRQVLWLDAIRPRQATPWWAAWAVVAVTGAMFAGIVSLRVGLAEPGAATLVLLCVPVTFLALSFGRWIGLVGAAAAVGAVALWDLTGGDPGGPLGYVSRGTAFVLLAFFPGWLAETLRSAGAEAERAQQRAARQRYAREVNDEIVQGLVAAEIALDLGETRYARALVAATSRHARDWIGELLADEGPLQPGAARRTAPPPLPSESSP